MQLGDVLKNAARGNGKTTQQGTDVVGHIMSLAAAAGMSPNLIKSEVFAGSVLAAIHQDDDAHDTCTLTACLNPLHPGPCKGWKHTLHQTSPAAWHALEAARVEKANKNRIAKIEALKAQGKPIPKKLLAPIVAKSHPDAGKTANSATGEAHAAGKAVSEASGVHVKEPGKVSLGQAAKTLGQTVEKGPKGKKPTLASKGIAFIIGQEKVTPQYKLDKAATITPEQWNALSHDDKAAIRGELLKIKKDGFGPQQKKASELLGKLPAEGKVTEPKPEAPKPKLGELKPGTPGTITTPSGKTYQKVNLPKAEEDPTSAKQVAAATAISNAIPGIKAIPESSAAKLTEAFDKLKSKGALEESAPFKAAVDKMAQAALKVAHEDKLPGLGHGDNDIHIGTINKAIADHIKEGKPGLPDVISKIVAHHETAKTGNVKTGVENLIKNGLPPKAEAKPISQTPTKLSQGTKGEPLKDAYEAAKSSPGLHPPKPKPVPKHVQHAIDMANGHAPGASWSKNHLAAYQPLTAEEFHALPPDTQAKIVAELKKGETKFLDPKKQQATKDLLAKFGKGPSTPTTPKAEKPKIENVSFFGHMHNHDVTQAQAKEAVAGVPVSHHATVAIQVTGIPTSEMPDVLAHKKGAETDAKNLLALQTKGYEPSVLNTPDAKAATDHLLKAATDLAYAQRVGKAKENAYNKITLALAKDTGQFSPIQKESLHSYQKYLLSHPVATDQAHLQQLQNDTLKAVNALHDTLFEAKKKASSPKPGEMTGAQLDSKVKELLGADVVDPTKPKTSASLAEMQHAKNVATATVETDSKQYPASVLADPTVAAKQSAYINAVTSLNATKVGQQHLNDHIKQLHEDAILSGEDINGNPLSKEDKQALALHAAKLAKDNPHVSPTAVQHAQNKADQAKAEFHAAAEKAAAAPAEPVKLSDYDQNLITTEFSNAWGKHASKATTYGVDSFAAAKMKAHSQYAQFTQDLGNLKALAGKVALAHAEEHTAQLNVPTDPDTGALEMGPEHTAWLAAISKREELEGQFNALHKQAQARLDTIRTAAGLKKRSLPKLNAEAVKATAAEGAYYKTASYSGPNYGKAASAKSYMEAKVGPKLGVKHMTLGEKKAVKLGDLATAPKPKSTVPTGTPVKLGGDASIGHIPDPVKKAITSDFKSMPKGKYLADPAEDIFGNLVNLAAAHGKGIDGGLSVEQVLKTIDETHSKNLGVANSGMLEKKVTDWLATAAGKEYAEKHSVADDKVVKQLTGELDLPAGVTLAPGQKVQKVAGPGPHDESLDHSAFKKASTVSAQVAQDQWMKDNGVKWSAQQKKALKAYTGSSYHSYNSYLRHGGSLSPAMKQEIIDIQSAMMPLAQHTLLRRGTGWDALPAQFQGFENAKKLIGKTIEEPGFTSTTVAGESGHFGGPLQLEIEAPKGTAAAFVNGISHYKNKENEMLLAAGTKFKILEVTQKGHQTVMRVRVVGDK